MWYLFFLSFVFFISGGIDFLPCVLFVIGNVIEKKLQDKDKKVAYQAIVEDGEINLIGRIAKPVI